ncbi:hypothetical protein OURE66S_03534 [Oligella ureolytica]
MREVAQMRLTCSAGFGPTMVFLFVSPLLNPIILGLLLVTFGFKLTIIYATSALLISLFSGWFLHKLNFQKYIILDTITPKTSCETIATIKMPILNVLTRLTEKKS